MGVLPPGMGCTPNLRGPQGLFLKLISKNIVGAILLRKIKTYLMCKFFLTIFKLAVMLNI